MIEANTSDAKIILVQDEVINAAPTGMVVYYYVVLEYPVLDSDKNIEIKGELDGVLAVEESGFKPGKNIMAVYIKDDGDDDYVKSDDIPSKSAGLGFNKSKSNCTNEAIPIWNKDDWNITIDNLTKKTSCYLYFDKKDA